jgi:hypothetical protein
VLYVPLGAAMYQWVPLLQPRKNQAGNFEEIKGLKRSD